MIFSDCAGASFDTVLPPPPEAAGIKVEGEYKWLTIIQNAATQTRANDEKNQT